MATSVRMSPWILSSLLMLGYAASAHAVVLVRDVEQLSNDRNVKAQSGTYRAVSSANVVYDQCAKQYQVNDADRKYLDELFTRVSKDYVDAYHNAYESRVGYPPDIEMVDSYTKIIAAEQQQVVNQTAAAIKTAGCGSDSIQRIVRYIEQMRVRELHANQ